MAKRLLIIGNGFDIDLGLKTRYSDFSKSKIWEKLVGTTFNYDSDLLGALREAKETEAWFDIEKTMNDYVRALKLDYLVSDLIDKDKSNFIKVSESLSQYLKRNKKKEL